MKKFFTFIAAALMAVGANAQTQLTLGGQSANGSWSWGWNQTFGAEISLSFSSAWGEFVLANTGVVEGATYKLVVAEANDKVNLRINNSTEADVKYIGVSSTEVTGTIPAGATNIELQSTEAGARLDVKSFTIDGVQTEYATNWGVAMFSGKFVSTSNWAELMLNGAEGKAGQDIIITANEAIPEDLQLKVIYADDAEGYPAVPAGNTTAKVYLEKPFKQVSLQAKAADVTIDIASVVASFGVWTVAGSSTLLGTSWDTANTDNDMTTTDGVTYTLVKENIVLEKGVAQEFKVLKDHSWDVNYGPDGVAGSTDNVKLTVDETATYTVTFTFDSQTHIISAVAEKTGSGEVAEKTYSVIGTINGNWDTDTDMTKGEDGLYTAVFENVAVGSYEFKVRVNHVWDEAYPSSNYKLTVSELSNVTVTFNADTKEVKAVAASATGIETAKVVKLQNGARYNLAGQMVTPSYKGVVIVNGRKMIVR